MEIVSNNLVYISRDTPNYCNTPPFHPTEEYPECKSNATSIEDNPAYSAIRRLFVHMGLDVVNFGSEEWNPLGVIISPGNTVILKPNFVTHKNTREDASSRIDLDCLVTHGSVIRAIVDYVAIALQGEGHIVIADCPLQSADWNELVEMVGLVPILEYSREMFPSIKIELIDYRIWRSVYRDGRMISGQIKKNVFELQQELDLGRRSLLVPLMNEGVEFGVTQYPRDRLRAAHNSDVNRYICPKAFLDADVIINLPKMKSHMKAGITGAMKNFVGIIGLKDYLPHFRFGSPKNGGDEYPDGSLLLDVFWSLVHREWDTENIRAKVIWQRLSQLVLLLGYTTGNISRSDCQQGGGSWKGNDTLWRTILDINRAFIYYDRDKRQMGKTPWPRTQYLSIMDGIIGGHKNSPLAPDPIETGLIIGSFNPLALDTVATALMGYDYRKVKQINEGFHIHDLPIAKFLPDDIEILGDISIEKINQIYQDNLFVPFEASVGWKGAVEWL